MLTFLDPLRQMTFGAVLFRLFLSLVLGGIIGIGREKYGRAAGFRTHMLVCLGATLATILAQYYYAMYTGPWADAVAAIGARIDVSRLGSQVITGVGFLGAGTILVTEQKRVRGLTTAAGIWMVALLGIATGAGFFEGVIVTFILVMLTMQSLRKVEVRRKIENGSVDSSQQTGK